MAKLTFPSIQPPKNVSVADWSSWSWQIKNSLKSLSDYEAYFSITDEERSAFIKSQNLFRIQSTPYYAKLISESAPSLRPILVPHSEEFHYKYQQMRDPLAEGQNSPVERIIHRYSDRVLFLVTDFCSVYCRFCTRKHFTGKSSAFPSSEVYEKALNYIKGHPGIREVILSGGDPLTLSNSKIEKVLSDLTSINHVELIRIGSRMPVVNPYRLDKQLLTIFQKYPPLYFMHHFNHPKEISCQSGEALQQLANHGVVQMNQMVLLNGVNNHPALVQALSRRLLRLRVKPYYMFQCDPSEGSDHFRTNVEQALTLQRELWGHLSGLAMPTLCLDIPSGGGKISLVPDFLKEKKNNVYTFKGWDQVQADYISPGKDEIKCPSDIKDYEKEWSEIQNSRSYKKTPQAASSPSPQSTTNPKP